MMNKVQQMNQNKNSKESILEVIITILVILIESVAYLFNYVVTALLSKPELFSSSEMIKGFPEIFVADNIIMMSATILNIIAIVKLLKSLYVAKKNIIRSYEYKVKAFKDIKLTLIADAIIVLLFIIAHIIGGVSIINISAILIVEILPLSIITELVLWRNYRNTNKLKELCAMDTDKLENLEVEQNNNIKTKETIISVPEITIITVISLVVLLNSISIVTVAIGITMSDIIKHNYISMIWHSITILLILITNVFSIIALINLIKSICVMSKNCIIKAYQHKVRAFIYFQISLIGLMIFVIISSLAIIRINDIDTVVKLEIIVASILAATVWRFISSKSKLKKN